jgi:hypothetical protein
MILHTPRQKYLLRQRKKLWQSNKSKDLAVIVDKNLDVKYILKNTEHEQD